MTTKTPLDRDSVKFRRNLLGALDAHAVHDLAVAGGDVAMVLDRDGVIRDVAVSSADLLDQGFGRYLDARWLDVVAADSRPKVEELLRDAGKDQGRRWREINHVGAGGGDEIPLRCIALDARSEGRLIALGRDHRTAARLQQSLLQAQQSMERDYSRLREAETRYRLLFQLASEAVLIVEAGSKKVVEANPAAQRLLAAGALVGRPFAKLFAAESRDAAAALLVAGRGSVGNGAAETRLICGGRAFLADASLYRQGRATHILIRLTPADAPGAHADPRLRLIDVVDRIPDAFVLTDADMRIVTENAAFADLAGLTRPEQARGEPLERFLGRPGVDQRLLQTDLREHGVVRNFATIVRTAMGETEDVEVSAVAALDEAAPSFGFVIRRAGRRLLERAATTGPARSVEQLTRLVGRVTLKELVRESTDLVERLCIEAALELTGDNRASAAEILGLSRQSLYAKLHRYGLGNLPSSAQD